jgi:hypothetical protein
MKEINEEIHDQDDNEYCFSIDFSKLPAKRNWD